MKTSVHQKRKKAEVRTPKTALHLLKVNFDKNIDREFIVDSTIARLVTGIKFGWS